jgi:uncharacterized membrane protein YoaK (UPF0700 family)
MPQAVAFAVIAGYADAVGYLRFGAFAGMMTGNTVLLGLSFFHGAQQAPWEYAGLLACFFAAAITAHSLLPRTPQAVWLLAEAILILLADAIGSAWSIVFLVLAMGVQNPVAARFGVPLNTTFITGDILRFAEGVARRWHLRSEVARPEPFAIYGLVWLGYAFGAGLGAALYLLVAWPLLVPVALLGFIYAWHRREMAQ